MDEFNADPPQSGADKPDLISRHSFILIGILMNKFCERNCVGGPRAQRALLEYDYLSLSRCGCRESGGAAAENRLQNQHAEAKSF